MIDELLQERAALYVLGTMTAQERGEFELVAECHPELRAFTAALGEVAVALTLHSPHRDVPAPSPGLKARILAALGGRPQSTAPEGLVMSGADGFVQWINPAFSAICGYALDELRGKKLGPILQGEKTDRETAERMRRAVHQVRPCRETILNYHKNGAPYWVEIAITPICDDAGQPLWLIARERELTGTAA